MASRSGSRRWHKRPESGLVSSEPSARTLDERLDYSDGGLSWFPDVGFPAHREDLYRSAVAHGAPPDLLSAIRRLPHVLGAARDVPDLYALMEEIRRERQSL